MEKKLNELEELECLYQENIEQSKILSILTEALTFKISDYATLINKTKEDSLILISKCSFLQLNDDKETVSYPESFTIYLCTGTNFTQATIDQLSTEFSFERIRERKDKKTALILSKASDHDRLIKALTALNIKYDKLTRAHLQSIVTYSKESFNLKPKHKNSDTGSIGGNSQGGNSWRKYSGQSKNSFDNSYKYSSYNNNNSNKKYKRERFNSDNNSSKWNNNSNYSNYNFRPQVEEIEIDISKIKYSLHIKYKYPLEVIQKVYMEMKEKKILDVKPVFIKNEEIVCEKMKPIVAFGAIDTGNTSNSNNNGKDIMERINEDGKKAIGDIVGQGSDLKIPKTNPLSNMPKNYNKFDMIPQNKGQTNTTTTTNTTIVNSLK